MRLRTLPPHQRTRRKRRTLRTIQVLPTLITAGNLVAGVLAISYLIDAAALPDQAELLFVRAAWLIFIGMFCDVLDGRIARMTGTTSSFGAQLDSLADAVTFGVAPALLAKSVLAVAFPMLSSRMLFSFCLVYVLGATLRLARYNVESERTSAAGLRHVTRIFRGLPSPAAAGVVAALVLVRPQYAALAQAPTEWGILLSVPLLGMLMISRMPYSHLMNRYFDARRAQPIAVVVLILLVYLFISHFVETVAGLFLLYALAGPTLTLTNRWLGWPAWVLHEEEDELELEPEDGDELEPEDGDDLGTGTGAGP